MTILFDLVFHNGEFINETSTSLIEKSWIFFVSLCGIGIPLLLFYLGLKKEREKENKRKIDRQSDNLKYFAILIENVKDICVKQADNCIKVSNKIVDNPFAFPVLEEIVATDIKRIVNLVNHEDIFHAYVSKFGNETENIHDFRVIFSYLDYLDKIYEQHIEDYKNYKKKFSNKYHTYNNISDDLMEHVAILINVIKKEDSKYNENKFWNYINELILEYYSKLKEESLEKSIAYDYGNFIKPIKEKLILSFRDNKNSEYIVSQAKKATYIHTEIVDLSKEMKTDFSTFNDNFNSINDKLVEKTDELVKINAT